MGRKRRIEIKFGQKKKKKIRRRKLLKQGRNPDEYFYDGFYVAKSDK